MKNNERIGVLIVLLLAVALRAPGLTTRSLWLDEYTSIEIASKPFLDIVAGSGFDSHTPPFYYALLHIWLVPFSADEFGLRLFSLVVDLANVMLVFLIFSRQFSPGAGRVAGLFVALSPYAIYYAQEGRMYSLVLLLVLITYAIALRIRTGRAGFPLLAAFFIVAVAGMYTHYYYALSLFAIVIATTVSVRGDRQTLARLWGTALLVGIAFLPWLRVVSQILTSEGQTFRQFSYSVFPYSLFRFTAGYGVLPLNHGDKDNFYGTVLANLPVIALYIGTFGAALALAFRKLRQAFSDEVVFLVAPLVIPPLLAIGVNLYTPMLSERYLIVIFPFFAGLLALVGENRPRGSRTWWFALCLFILTGWGTVRHYTNGQFGNTQWRDAAEVIDNRTDLCARVIVNPHYLEGIVDYYLKVDHSFLDARESGSMRAALESSDGGGCRGFWIIERGTAKSLEQMIPQDGIVLYSKFFPLENGVRLLYVEPAS